MRKIVIIILALVVALGALPVSFACYTGWDDWNWFWQPDTTVYCCPTYCNVIFTSVDAYDNEETFIEYKDVGDTTASIIDCGKKLTITIDNAYPLYEGIIDFCIKNTGNMAATITGITTDYPDPAYLQVNFTGEIIEGTVINPCETKCGQLVIGGIPQLEDAQNRIFTFDIIMDYVCSCVPLNCETAYARSWCYSTCFSYWGFSQWGWTNGPLQPGFYRFPLYAGAAQCDISKGKHVGYLTVCYNGSTASVTYNMFYGHKMTETHLYVGPTPIPPNNKPGVPGLYPYKHDLNNAWFDMYQVTGLSGPIYIIAHAEVCW